MVITPFTLVLFMASFMVFLAAGSAWRKRDVAGGPSLTLLFLAIGIWSFFTALETTSESDQQRYIWSALSYLGLCNVTPLLLVFSIQYSDARWRLTAWTYVVFWSIPAVTVALAITNGSHHLIWTGITPGPVGGTNTVIYHHGPWYWIELIWFSAQSLAASFLLLRVALRAARLYVLQAIILLICILLPWIGLLLYLLPNGPIPGLDTTSLGFAVSAVLILTALGRLRFMDLVPQARATLVEHMKEGFLVLDARDRVIDINPTARRLLRVDSAVVGGALSHAFPMLSDFGRDNVQNGIRLLSPFPETDITLELSVSPLVSRTGRQSGRLILMRDVSDRRRADLEREKLIVELRSALSRVKRLSGLLPICASCKKIRDDSGYWHQVESYMQDHTEVEFSHGICPECAAKLYPEAFEGSESTKS